MAASPRSGRLTSLTSIRLLPDSPLIFTSQPLTSISLLSQNSQPVTINIYSDFSRNHELMMAHGGGCGSGGYYESSTENDPQSGNENGSENINYQFLYNPPHHLHPHQVHNHDIKNNNGPPSPPPPIPSYAESQRQHYSMHPGGSKRLPHFHPPPFNKRLRMLISQRQRPHPLALYSGGRVISTSGEHDTGYKNFSEDEEKYREEDEQWNERRALKSCGSGRGREIESGTREKRRGFEECVDPRVGILVAVVVVLGLLGALAWVLAVRAVSGSLFRVE